MCKSSEITENQAKNIVVNQDDLKVHDVKDDSKKSPGKPRGAKGKRKQTKKSRSIVEDVDKCTSLRNVQPLVRFATNANKGIENVPVQIKGQL